jgi:hypothetical protein
METGRTPSARKGDSGAEARLALALRANLRRRKSAPRAETALAQAPNADDDRTER